MITYELAKKLKEAGFPQGGNGGWQLQDTDNERFYSPTLSELIEACGDRFSWLESYKDNETTIGKIRWGAYGFGDGEWNPEGFGNSPEEAVANLWLKLNNK
jgi:hypothetical protein